MITEAVRAVADMFANLFGWRTSAVENQTTSEVIGDKHDREKACRAAARAIEIAERHAFFDMGYQKRFEYQVKKFRRYLAQ